MIEYTDAQKAENFRQILGTIRYIRNQGRITEDWMTEHKKHILHYRNYFGDFNLVNPDCKNRRFRMLAEDTELVLNHLVSEIEETGYFTVEMYLKLNSNLKRMMEVFYDINDLSELFENSTQF